MGDAPSLLPEGAFFFTPVHALEECLEGMEQTLVNILMFHQQCQ